MHLETVLQLFPTRVDLSRMSQKLNLNAWLVKLTRVSMEFVCYRELIKFKPNPGNEAWNTWNMVMIDFVGPNFIQIRLVSTKESKMSFYSLEEGGEEGVNLVTRSYDEFDYILQESWACIRKEERMVCVNKKLVDSEEGDGFDGSPGIFIEMKVVDLDSS